MPSSTWPSVSAFQSESGFLKFKAYCETIIGECAAFSGRPLSGDEVILAISNLNDWLEPRLNEIKATKYDVSYFQAADSVIDKIVADGLVAQSIASLELPVLRVIFERYVFLLARMWCSEERNEPGAIVPEALTKAQTFCAVVYSQLYGAEIPFPLTYSYSIDIKSGVLIFEMAATPKILH